MIHASLHEGTVVAIDSLPFGIAACHFCCSPYAFVLCPFPFSRSALHLTFLLPLSSISVFFPFFLFTVFIFCWGSKCHIKRAFCTSDTCLRLRRQFHMMLVHPISKSFSSLSPLNFGPIGFSPFVVGQEFFGLMRGFSADLGICFKWLKLLVERTDKDWCQWCHAAKFHNDLSRLSEVQTQGKIACRPYLWVTSYSDEIATTYLDKPLQSSVKHHQWFMAVSIFPPVLSLLHSDVTFIPAIQWSFSKSTISSVWSGFCFLLFQFQSMKCSWILLTGSSSSSTAEYPYYRRTKHNLSSLITF